MHEYTLSPVAECSSLCPGNKNVQHGKQRHNKPQPDQAGDANWKPAERDWYVISGAWNTRTGSISPDQEENSKAKQNGYIEQDLQTNSAYGWQG